MWVSDVCLDDHLDEVRDVTDEQVYQALPGRLQVCVSTSV